MNQPRPVTKDTKPLVHASLFSGIGGPEVAAAMLGWRNAFHCEINPFGRQVLDYWFPDSMSYEDITKTDFSPWRGKIDVLTGGFPCQPFSYAGKRGGREDERYLWPQMLRAIDEIRPSWVVGENVAGLSTMVEGGLFTHVGSEATLFGEGDELHEYTLQQCFTIERICSDLEHIGYSVQPVLIPAAATGAPHRRERIFILVHAEDAVGLRCGLGGDGIQGRLGDVGNACAGNCQRVCAEAGANPADAEGEQYAGPQPLEPGHLPETGKGEEPGGSHCGGGAERQPSHPFRKGLERENEPGCGEGRQWMHIWGDAPGYLVTAGEDLLPENRWACFPTVSPVHRGNDGLPFSLDDLTISAGKWRKESLKAYGNAIVPQVMYRIFQAIEAVSRQ